MKKRYWIALGLVGMAIFLSIIILNAEYCYTEMFFVSYDGIFHKKCICDGKELRDIPFCPPGAACDSPATITCLGKIRGFEYVFEDNIFSELKEWEDYCNSKENEKKEDCLMSLNKTILQEKIVT